jgi:hypothetical protein
MVKSQSDLANRCQIGVAVALHGDCVDEGSRVSSAAIDPLPALGMVVASLLKSSRPGTVKMPEAISWRSGDTRGTHSCRQNRQLWGAGSRHAGNPTESALRDGTLAGIS